MCVFIIILLCDSYVGGGCQNAALNDLKIRRPWRVGVLIEGSRRHESHLDAPCYILYRESVMEL
jgi:hypothetical protein